MTRELYSIVLRHANLSDSCTSDRCCFSIWNNSSERLIQRQDGLEYFPQDGREADASRHNRNPSPKPLGRILLQCSEGFQRRQCERCKGREVQKNSNVWALEFLCWFFTRRLIQQQGRGDDCFDWWWCVNRGPQAGISTAMFYIVFTSIEPLDL